MFFNDEWITGNQLNQLSHGSQILYNEGKYGTYENGTPYTYFEIRGNSLPYTSYLPILSLPILLVLLTLENAIQYLIISIWISISLLLLVYYYEVRSKVMKTYYEKFRIFLFLSVFFFLALNLLYYMPISLSSKADDPEILGIAMYHVILFSLLSAVIYLINSSLFIKQDQVLFGTITSICCSSAFFWMTTLKDHVDVIFFVALLLYSMILHIKSGDDWFAFVSFGISGILFWIRPEYGAFIFLSLLFCYLPIIMYKKITKTKYNRLFILLSPISAILGALPLFVNNYFVMGNPLKFPWQLASKYVIVNNDIRSPMETISISQQSGGLDIIHNIFSLFWQRITPDGNVVSGLFSSFMLSDSLKVPIFILAPLFLLSIFMFLTLPFYSESQFKTEEKTIILLLFSIIAATIIAYFSSITGLSNSIGIYPDVRYWSPMYLPLTLIGLIIIQKYDYFDQKYISIIKNVMIITSVGVIIVLAVTGELHLKFAYSDFFLWINSITTLLVYIALGLNLVLSYLNSLNLISPKYIHISLSFLIALPFIWQISQVIILNFSGNLFDQYPPLLPAVRVLFNYLSGGTTG